MIISEEWKFNNIAKQLSKEIQTKYGILHALQTPFYIRTNNLYFQET